MPTPLGLQGGAAGERPQQEAAPLLQRRPHQQVLQLQPDGRSLNGIWGRQKPNAEVEQATLERLSLGSTSAELISKFNAEKFGSKSTKDDTQSFKDSSAFPNKRESSSCTGVEMMT